MINWFYCARNSAFHFIINVHIYSNPLRQLRMVYCIVLCEKYIAPSLGLNSANAEPSVTRSRMRVHKYTEPHIYIGRQAPPNCIIWLICYQEQLKQNIHIFVQPQQLLPAHNMVAAESYLKNNIFFFAARLAFHMCHIQFFFSTDFSGIYTICAMEELFCRTFQG